MKGFTLIELLVTIIITVLVFTGIVAGYTRFTDTARIKQTAATLKNDLRVIQNKALSGVKPIGASCDQLDGYLMTFTVTTYSYQARCDSGPAGRATAVALPSNMTFSPVPPQLLFRVLTHGVNVNSDVTMTIVISPRSYALKLTPQGDIIDLGFQQ